MVRNSTNFSAFLDFTMTSENREIFTDFVEEKILLVKDNKRLTVMKFCGEEEDLIWIKEKMREWYAINVRAVLGTGKGDDK